MTGTTSVREETIPALSADHMTKRFTARGGLFRRAPESVLAVDDVSLAVPPGRTLGIVGESGSGKTTLARMLVGLTPATSGTVRVNGDDTASMSARERHRRQQYVFQDPYSSLNPRMTIGASLEVPLRKLLRLDSRDRREARSELLDQIGLGAAVAGRYPHELSGGQRQRVVLARAMAARPSVVVLDEPVSALDVSVQAQILALLRDLQQQWGTTYVFISHDLAVVESLCDDVLVMQSGTVMERGSRDRIFTSPQHPYTRLLLSSVPGQQATDVVSKGSTE